MVETNVCVEINEIIKKKKRGFTLIELIAVIAILAILGAILVPKISGYSDSAKAAKAISDAAIIVNAVSAYNADQSSATTPSVVGSDATFKTAGSTDASGTNVTILVGVTSAGITLPKEISEDYTLAKLKLLAASDKSAVKFTAGLVTTP